MTKFTFFLILFFLPTISYSQNYNFQDLEKIYINAKPSTNQDMMNATGVYESYSANQKGVTLDALGFIAYRAKDHQKDSTAEHCTQPIMNLRINRPIVENNRYFWPFVYNLIHGIDSPYIVSVDPSSGIYSYLANQNGIIDFAGQHQNVNFVSQEGFVFENTGFDGPQSYTVRNCSDKTVCDYIIKDNNYAVYTIFKNEISDCTWTPNQLLHPDNTKCPIVP